MINKIGGISFKGAKQALHVIDNRVVKEDSLISNPNPHCNVDVGYLDAAQKHVTSKEAEPIHNGFKYTSDPDFDYRYIIDNAPNGGERIRVIKTTKNVAGDGFYTGTMKIIDIDKPKFIVEDVAKCIREFLATTAKVFRQAV